MSEVTLPGADKASSRRPPRMHDVPLPAAPSAGAPSSGPLMLLPAAEGGVDLVAKFFRRAGRPGPAAAAGVPAGRRAHGDRVHRPGRPVAGPGVRAPGLPGRLRLTCRSGAPGGSLTTWVADPRVADLVVLARSLAADNAAALSDGARIDPS